MDRVTKNQIIDDAIGQITAHPGSMATMVEAMVRVFSEGYKHGLDQGHYDRDHPEG